MEEETVDGKRSIAMEEETIAPKRSKSHHLLDFSSDPPPVPCSAISSVTTMKMFLSWCRGDKEKNPRVFELVTHLRKKLWERGIEVFDDDVELRVTKERYIPIMFMTVEYFDDSTCLEELKVICKSNIMHMLPIFYDSDGGLRRIYTDIMSGPYWYRPLLTPWRTPWSPDEDKNGDADDMDNDADNGKDSDGDDNDDTDNDGKESDDDDTDGDDAEDDDEDDDGTDIEEEEDNVADDGKEGDVVDKIKSMEVEEEMILGDAMLHIDSFKKWLGYNEADDGKDSDVVDKIKSIEVEEEMILGDAMLHIDRFKEWLEMPVVNDSKAECGFIDHFVLFVWMFLNPGDLDYTYLVGLQSRLNQFRETYLFSEKESTYIAITGPEGSGKTTTAKFLYNVFCLQTSFYHTRMISRPKSLSLNEIAGIIFGIFAQSAGGIWKPEESHKHATELYESRPLLIILDNINTINDFEYVAPILSLMPKNGCRVVFTTRDDSWLKSKVNGKGFKTYPIPALDVDSSLELFCLKAFKQNRPPAHCKRLADNVVEMAKGIPSDLVHCASQFRLMDRWTKAFVKNEKLDKLFWSKYVPRCPMPPTSGSESKPDTSYPTIVSFGSRDHQKLLGKIFRCMKANSLDYETDRVRTIYCG